MFKALKRTTYFVEDIEKAKQWYNNILSMQPVYDTPFAAIYNIGNCSMSLCKNKTQLNEPPTRMDVYWEVDDIETAFQKMVDNGATVSTPITQVLNIRTALLIDPFGNKIGLTGQMENIEQRTVENKPSATAMSVTYCRALAFKDDRQEIKGPDNIAEIFLTDETKKTLEDEKSMKWAIQNLVTSRLYGYFLARTTYFDHAFKSACEENIPQIVFLGAGYDTRACRYKDIIKSTRIFELDILPTQQHKKEILQKNNIPIPETLTYIPINFKTEKIETVLQKAGYDRNSKTLFIWEGVTYYLSPENIKGTLDFLINYAGEGSVLCFDYMTQECASINQSEPFLFWLEKEKLEGLLAKYGFSVKEQIGPEEMKKRYLTLNDGTYAEDIMPFFNIVKAVLTTPIK